MKTSQHFQLDLILLPGQEVRVASQPPLQPLVPGIQDVDWDQNVVSPHILDAPKALHEVEQVQAHPLGKVLLRAQLAAFLLPRLLCGVAAKGRSAMLANFLMKKLTASVIEYACVLT